MEKLKGNQNVRNTITGEFATETERNDPERVVETDKPEKAPEMSAWLQEWMRTGKEIEASAGAEVCIPGGKLNIQCKSRIDEWTVAAVLHVQALKRA